MFFFYSTHTHTVSVFVCVRVCANDWTRARAHLCLCAYVCMLLISLHLNANGRELEWENEWVSEQWIDLYRIPLCLLLLYMLYSIAGLQFIDNMCQYVVINCLYIRPPHLKWFVLENHRNWKSGSKLCISNKAEEKRLRQSEKSDWREEWEKERKKRRKRERTQYPQPNWCLY